MPTFAPSRSRHPSPRAARYDPVPRSAAEDIAFGQFDSPLGIVLLGVTARGIRYLALGDSAAALEREMRAALPWASFSRTLSVPDEWHEEITRRLAGAAAHTPLPLHTNGTPFEESVWAVLRRIPRGERRTYQQLAAEIGRPTAVRAVAQACAHNNVAVLIPCHRVVRADGTLGGYRWGVDRKQTLLDAERTPAETSASRDT
jgi:AraC family transcriptional regulator of adaptative response/methylated-DNA-[protein]-cysteine methyltransferase